MNDVFPAWVHPARLPVSKPPLATKFTPAAAWITRVGKGNSAVHPSDELTSTAINRLSLFTAFITKGSMQSYI